MMKKLLVTFLFSFFVAPLLANADCTNPAGAEGAVIYNSTAKMLQFCNGTVWVNASGVSPSAGSSGLAAGAIDWSDCEYFNACAPTGSSATISCTSGRVMVTSACSATSAGTSSGEVRDAANYQCYINGVNSMYARGDSTDNGTACASIKCCTVVTE